MELFRFDVCLAVEHHEMLGQDCFIDNQWKWDMSQSIIMIISTKPSYGPKWADYRWK